ncbi:MAG TPA: hypothetical protein VN771_07105 [Candidatus Baltobacteraceae bacterium]|nr:hypothetical protein [Candidatus Baltobacteraceae bacterium]
MADTPTPPEASPAPRRRRARPVTPPPPAESATAGQVSLANLTAEHAEINQGAIAHAQVQDLAVRQGAVALVQSSAHVRLDQSAVGAVVGDQVELGAGSVAFLVVAREVHGDVKPLIDWRGALAFGVALGLARRLLGGRDRRHG